MPLLISVLAIIGGAVSWYIHYTRRRQKKLVCFLGQDCNAVVYSKYNALLGVPNELLGVFYYAVMVVLMLLVFIGVITFSGWIAIMVYALSVVAAVFSSILLAIQLGILHKLCEYCLVSTIVNFVITVLLFMASLV